MMRRGNERIRRRQPTPNDYRAVLDLIARSVEDVERELSTAATVGVCHPGAISPATGRIKNANTAWLRDRAFDQDVRERLGRPVALANDADCLALSEATDGAGQGGAGRVRRDHRHGGWRRYCR